MFEKTFRHASVEKLLFFIASHPRLNRGVLSSDTDTIADGLNEFSDLLIGSFVAEAYSLSKVLLPVELYGATEGSEVSSEGNVVFRTGLLKDGGITYGYLCVTKRGTEAKC